MPPLRPPPPPPPPPWTNDLGRRLSPPPRARFCGWCWWGWWCCRPSQLKAVVRHGEYDRPTRLERRREYLVKWAGQPYTACTWESAADVADRLGAAAKVTLGEEGGGGGGVFCWRWG